MQGSLLLFSHTTYPRRTPSPILWRRPLLVSMIDNRCHIIPFDIDTYTYTDDLQARVPRAIAADVPGFTINSPSSSSLIPDDRSMDPFEVRIRFTSMLQSLNASVTSANKTAQYALKYRDMDEDLHSCILEQLERNSMNNRANIMYFIEHLCDMAARENHQDYVRMIQRDILRVVDAVAPEDGSGAANVKVVRKVLQGLQLKAFLMAQTVSEIEECLKDRDVQPDAIGLSSPLQQDVEMNGTDAPTLSSQHTPLGQSKSKGANGVVKLDKRQIEQRIEEDRERHKRLRENIWAVPGGLDGENLKSWGETSDAGDDDYILYDEEKDERRAANREWKDERRSRTVVHGD